jgi:hypothetical protein
MKEKSPYISDQSVSNNVKPLSLMKMAPMKDTPVLTVIEKQSEMSTNVVTSKLAQVLLAERARRRKKDAIDRIIKKFHLEMNIHRLG